VFEGIFPEAQGGTIILDEIGLAPLWLQEALLSTLDKGVFTVVGAGRPTSVDVRIVSTANQDPTRAFRPDFDARLALRVHVPPVREHRDDIGFMLREFLEEADADALRAGAKGDLPSSRRISPTFVDFLMRHPLPTNARQIRNILHAALLADTPGHVKLTKSLIESIPPSRQPVSVAPASAAPVSQPRESQRESTPDGARRSGRPKEEPVRGETEVRESLAATGWDATKAAARLGISRGQMLRLMEKLGVKRPGP
jgi:DNA-binding NtrC family response regulator